MDDFNKFRRIYEAIDRHRRTAWMVAQRVWSSIVLQGYNSAEAGILRAAPEQIILGAKAHAQDIYDRIPSEPLSIDPYMLAEYRRKVDRDDPYRYVQGAQNWLMEGRWEDLQPDERNRLAALYDARMTRKGNVVKMVAK